MSRNHLLGAYYSLLLRILVIHSSVGCLPGTSFLRSSVLLSDCTAADLIQSQITHKHAFRKPAGMDRVHMRAFLPRFINRTSVMPSDPAVFLLRFPAPWQDSDSGRELHQHPVGSAEQRADQLDFRLDQSDRDFNLQRLSGGIRRLCFSPNLAGRAIHDLRLQSADHRQYLERAADQYLAGSGGVDHGLVYFDVCLV